MAYDGTKGQAEVEWGMITDLTLICNMAYARTKGQAEIEWGMISELTLTCDMAYDETLAKQRWYETW